MKDRRWHLRVKTSAKVVVVGAQSPCIGILQDISRSGARVSVASSELAPGTPLNLILQLSARSFKQVTGQVVHSGPVGVSLEFDNVLEGPLFERLALRNLVLSAASL
jgi:hypothetical protein